MIKTENYITKEIRRAAEQEALATLMNEFSQQMFGRIINNKDAEYSGWDSEESIENIKAKLANGLNNGDWIDVANLCMFLWNFKQQNAPMEVIEPPTQ